MGDTGEAFEAFNDFKREERAKKEPNRFKYAWDKLNHMELTLSGLGTEKIEIYLKEAKIDFWVYTGWFCGRKPLGYIKGRGLNNLLTAIKGLI